MKAKFKSIRPVKITHERGTEVVNNVCGSVIRIEKNKVLLRGLMYDFSISKSDFQNLNILTT